ncbi:MAG TPA: TSUP family transporter [Bacillales bacterium]|nr:TSUP family transporter [Bacillales bacterium]
MWELFLVLLILFIGSFLQGTSGFGFGLFCMGLLPFFLPLKSSTLLVLALTIIISLNIVLKLKEFLLIKELYTILIFALTGRVFSFFFLNYFGDMEIMKLILGFVLIGSVFYLNLKKKDLSVHFDGIYFAMIIGIVGGFIGGVFAVGGPFFVLYYLMTQTSHLNN